MPIDILDTEEAEILCAELAKEYFPALAGDAATAVVMIMHRAVLQLSLDYLMQGQHFGKKKKPRDNRTKTQRQPTIDKKLDEFSVLLTKLRTCMANMPSRGWAELIALPASMPQFLDSDGSLIPLHPNSSEMLTDFQEIVQYLEVFRNTIDILIQLANRAKLHARKPPGRPRRDDLYRFLATLGRAWMIGMQQLPNNSELEGQFYQFSLQSLSIIIPKVTNSVRSSEQKLMKSALKEMFHEKHFEKLVR